MKKKTDKVRVIRWGWVCLISMIVLIVILKIGERTDYLLMMAIVWWCAVAVCIFSFACWLFEWLDGLDKEK